MRIKYTILILVIVLSGFGFFWSSGSLRKDNMQKINRVDRRIRVMQEQLNSAKVLNQDLREVANVIENSLTESRELSIAEANDFVRELASFADLYNISVLGLTPRAFFAQNRILEQQFSIELECTYVQLGQYLTAIESYDYLVKVNTLEVRPQADKFAEVDGNRQTLYRVVLDLSIYKIVREA